MCAGLGVRVRERCSRERRIHVVLLCVCVSAVADLGGGGGGGGAVPPPFASSSLYFPP